MAFRNRFRAASLFISTCYGLARVAKSNEQTNVLLALLEEGQLLLEHEHDELTDLVLSDADGIWENADKHPDGRLIVSKLFAVSDPSPTFE